MDKEYLMEEKKDTADRMRAVRIKMGYTQEKFAELLDVAYPTYKKIEKAQSGVTVKQLRLLKEQLGVSADALLFGDGEELEDIWITVKNLSESDKLRMFLRLHAYLKEGFSVTAKEREILEKKGGQAQEILKLFEAAE